MQTTSMPLKTFCKRSAVLLIFGMVVSVGAWAQPATVPSATLNKIRNTQLVVVGYREFSVPFSYLDARHQPVGYSIDLCQKVVLAIQQHLGLAQLRIKYVPVSPATRIPLVANGPVDMECGVSTNTLERQRSVAFSVTTFLSEARLVSKRKDAIEDLNQLRGQVVVSTVGTTSMRRLNTLNQEHQLQMQIVAGRDDIDSFQMLNVGRAKAYLMDDVLLRGFVAQSAHPQDYVISQAVFSVEPYAIMLKRQDPAFKKVVDTALVDLFRSGEQQAIYQKWFMQPLEPSLTNLQLPMSAALKRVVAQPTDSGNPADYMAQ